MKYLVSSLVFLVFLGVGSAMAGDYSSGTIDLDALNATITNAIDNGEQWPSNALEVTRELFGVNSRHFISLPEDELQCGGHRHLINVVIMRGSFTRAWGWGDWCEFHYRKVDDGTWRLCYILPMNKDGARVRNATNPLKAEKIVERVE